MTGAVFPVAGVIRATIVATGNAHDAHASVRTTDSRLCALDRRRNATLIRPAEGKQHPTRQAAAAMVAFLTCSMCLSVVQRSPMEFLRARGPALLIQIKQSKRRTELYWISLHWSAMNSESFIIAL